MRDEAKDLRSRILSTAKNARGRRQYGHSLRREVLGYAYRRLMDGANQSEIADELGLHQAVLSEWLRGKRKDAAADLMASSSGENSQPVLVLPDGTRVEGLEPAELVRVLRALQVKGS